MTERTHFVRVLDWLDVNSLVDLISAVAGRTFPAVGQGQESFEIKAPDGDVVFAGIRHPSGKFVCRFHKDVFDEED